MNRRGGCARRRRRAQRIYRLLVRLYPAAHRREFGEQMVQTFGDHYFDAVEGCGTGRLRFWLAVVADAGVSLVAEYAAEIRSGRRRLRLRLRRGGMGRRVRAVRYRRRGGLAVRVVRPFRYLLRGDWPVRVARLLRYRRRGGLAVRVVRPFGYLRRGDRPVRVARPLRYRGRGGRPVRVVIRTRHHRLVYRGRISALIALAVLTCLALGTGAAAGHLGVGALVAGLAGMAWLARSLRLTRPVLAGPRGDGPEPPGGASVREPRRPLPMSPAGSTARPRPDQDEPGQAVALI